MLIDLRKFFTCRFLRTHFMKLSKNCPPYLKCIATLPCKICLLKIMAEFSLMPSYLFLGRPYYRSSLWYTVSSVCLSVVVSLSVCRLSVTFCIVAKRYVLAKKCLKELIGNQGQKVHFLVAAIFLLPVSPLRPPRRPFLPYVLWRNGTS